MNNQPTTTTPDPLALCGYPKRSEYMSVAETAALERWSKTYDEFRKAKDRLELLHEKERAQFAAFEKSPGFILYQRAMTERVRRNAATNAPAAQPQTSTVAA